MDLVYANDFFLRGSTALSYLETNGVKIDRAYFDNFAEDVDKDMAKAQKVLTEHEYAEEYLRRIGKPVNLTSNAELKVMLFDIAGILPLSHTDKGSAQVNDGLFEWMDGNEDPAINEFGSNIRKFKNMMKLKGTYIDGMKRYIDPNDFLHPTYNLHVARTYRSSCDSPNLQNIPKRNEYMARIRKGFVPRFDLLVDSDYKGAEVVVQAMLAQDKILIEQLAAGYDMHRYWAAKLYKKSEDYVSKLERYKTKNGFFFPELYGSYYGSIAKNMDMPEDHVRSVEHEFYEMYYGIRAWQSQMLKFYNAHGFIETPLGFRRYGPLSQNQVVNTPIQATAFHCLLDTLIELTEAMEHYKFTSLPVLQIHDSITFDADEHEVLNLIELANELATDKPYWKFTKGVPLKVDWSKGPNFFDLEDVTA